MNSLFQNIYLPGADPEPKLEPTFQQTMSAAFGLENDVANVLDYMSRPTFQRDPEFKFLDEFKARNLPLSLMPILAPAQSQLEFNAILGRVQKETQQKAVLAASGWTGTVAALGAGILSPTSFIPFTGQAKGARAVAEMLGLALAGASAQNGALFLNQETRTEAELYTGVAMDTLLMGMMGGAYLGLSKSGRAQLGLDIKFNEKRVNIPQGASDVAPIGERALRVEPPQAAEIKRLVREENIRDPEIVQELMGEAGNDFVQLKDRALAIGPVVRRTAKSTEEQLANGRSFLEAPIADGVTARFVKVPAGGGGKWFTDGEYSITLRADDGTELTIPNSKIDNHAKAGATGIDKEAQLKKALAEGKLDDQLYEMLEAADEPRMAPVERGEAIPNSSAADAKAAGAAPTRTRNTQGAAKAPSRIRQVALDTLGKMNPAYRMATQLFSPALRNAAFMLDNAGIKQAGLETAEGSAQGGRIIERTRGYDPYRVTLAKALDKNFYEYTYGVKLDDKKFQAVRAAILQLKSVYGSTLPGKLNWVEYKKAVFEGINTGKFEPDIGNSVSALRDFFARYDETHTRYLEEAVESGRELKPLYKKLVGKDLGEGITGYAHHIPDQNYVMQNFTKFIDQFGSFYEKSLLADLEKSRKVYAKRVAKMENELRLSQLDDASLRDELSSVTDDIAFLDELPELQQYRDDRLDLIRQAKDGGWPPEQLKAEQKKALEALDPAVAELLNGRKRLLASARVLKKFGAAADETRVKLQGQLDASNELIAKMFRTELPKLRKADLSIKAVQKQGDAALKPVVAGIEKIVKQLQKRQAKMRDLLASSRGNTATRAKVAEQVEASQLKYAGMLERLKTVQGKQIALDVRLSELNRLREEAVADATLLVKDRAGRAAALEEKVDAANDLVLTPEERLRMKDQIKEDLTDLDVKFSNKWGVEGKVAEGAVDDLTPIHDKAVELATLLHQKLSGSNMEFSPVYHALQQEARGAELLRVWNVPWEIKKDWLVHDVELIAAAYDRTLAPDLELWRAFGSANGKELLEEMADEVTASLANIHTAKFVKLPKGWVDNAAKFIEKVKKRLFDAGDSESVFIEGKNFSDEAKPGYVPMTESLRNQISQSILSAAEANVEDLNVAILRLRRTRGVPKDSNDKWWRAGRAIKSLNVATMMGGVLTSSISDVARPVYEHGVQQTMKHGWAPFVDRLTKTGKDFNVRSRAINDQIGLTVDLYLHGRAQSFFDAADVSLAKTRLERGIQFVANKMGLIAMYDIWTAAMKSISGNVTHATMAAYIPAVAKHIRETPTVALAGDLLKMRTYLRNLGLTDLDIHRIGMQMEKPGGVEYFSNGGVLPNIDIWDDMAAYQAYQAAVLGEVNKLIVTPGLEIPNFVDENLAYSMLAQFKSFVFASNSRMAMSGLQGNDPYLMQGIVFSLAFGALSYYTYALTAGGKTLETANKLDPEKFLWEAVKRSGLLGALSIGADAGSNIPLLSGAETNTLFRKPDGLLGAFLGPTYSQANKMAEFFIKMDSGDPKQLARNLRILRQVWVPYQNHFLLRQLFDRAGDAMVGG